MKPRHIRIQQARAHGAYVYKKVHAAISARAATGELFTREDIATDAKTHVVFIQPALTSLTRSGVVRHVDTIPVVERVRDTTFTFTRHIERYQGATQDDPTN